MKNPIKEIKQEQNWTISEFAIACDISFSTTNRLLTGEQQSIPDEVIETLDTFHYYDISELKQDYKNYREYKRKELLT